MNLNKLHELSLLVTRPGAAGISLCEALEKEGARALYFPTIAFGDPPSTDKLLEGLKAIFDQDWIIFISPQAVASFIKYTDQFIDLSSLTARIAAIGDGTAAALKAAGMQPVVYPKYNATSEGLLALPDFHAITNQKITIVKGVGGREMLARELSARGAHIMPLITYQRVLPEINPHEVIASLNQKQIHVILCTSFDSVSNLCQLVGSHHLLKEVALVVMSERVKMLASQLGFSNIFIENVTNRERIVEFLYEKRNILCQMQNNKS